MKKIIFTTLVLGSLSLVACNAGSSTNPSASMGNQPPTSSPPMLGGSESGGFIINESSPIFPGRSLGVQQITQSKIGSGHLTSPQITKDGKFLFVADGKQIKTFLVGKDLATYRQVAAKSEGDTQNGIALSPDNHYLYSATSTGWINSYKVNPDGSLQYAGHHSNGDSGEPYSANYAIAFSPDDKLLFISGRVKNYDSFKPNSYKQFVWSYTVNGQNFTNQHKLEVDHKVRSFQVSPDGKYLYAATDNGFRAITLYKINSDGSLSHSGNNDIKNNATYSSLVLSKNGRSLYASNSGSIASYSIMPDDSLVYSKSDSINQELTGMVLDPSGLVIFATDANSVGVYDTSYQIFESTIPTTDHILDYYGMGVFYALLENKNPATGQNYLANFIYDPVTGANVPIIDYSNLASLSSPQLSANFESMGVDESSIVYDYAPGTTVIATATLNNDSDITQNMTSQPMSKTEQYSYSTTQNRTMTQGTQVTISGKYVFPGNSEIGGSASYDIHWTTGKSTTFESSISVTYEIPSQTVMVGPHQTAKVIASLRQATITASFSVYFSLSDDSTLKMTLLHGGYPEVYNLDYISLFTNALKNKVFDINKSGWLYLDQSNESQPKLTVVGKGFLQSQIGSDLNVTVEIYDNRSNQFLKQYKLPSKTVRISQ